jgi:hypothetical protein
MKLPNLGYRFALWRGQAIRRAYAQSLPFLVRRKIDPPRQLAMQVFAYSNEEMLPEQVASIRSFVRYAGRPKAFTVVSDGSHSRRSIELLRQIDCAVSVADLPPVPSNLPQKLAAYLGSHPTGKQLRLIMSLGDTVPALYVDADVRFFAGASSIGRELEQQTAPAYYLADCQFAGDMRLIRNSSEQDEPVNTGVLLLSQTLNWSVAIERFLEMSGTPAFHTNQTMTHLAVHGSGGRSFDPAKYVLQLDDQTVAKDRYAGPHLVLRHYVNPVRHKFWTSLRH